MERFLSLRVLLLSGILAISGFLVQTKSAFAASGSVTITQTSRSGVVGEWTMKIADGKEITSTDAFVNRSSYTLKNALPGTYTVTFEPPRGAKTSVELENGALKGSPVETLKLSFTLKSGESAKVSATYTFDGSIEVKSEPEGVAFRVTGPQGIDLVGKTPASYSNMPPFHYTVYYTPQEGCKTPKPQKRELPSNGKLIFFATFDCTEDTTNEDEVIPDEAEEETEAPRPTPDAQTEPRGRIAFQQVASQLEVVPGGTVLIVLRVSNPTNEILRDIAVSQTFDPSMLSITGGIPKNGDRMGNSINWYIASLRPDEVWTVTVQGRALDNQNGTNEIVVHAKVSSGDIPAPIERTTTVKIVKALPETGVSFDGLVLAITLLSAIALVRKTRELSM